MHCRYLISYIITENLLQQKTYAVDVCRSKNVKLKGGYSIIIIIIIMIIIIIIIIILSLFNEDNIFSKYTNLTYGPLKSKKTNST